MAGGDPDWGGRGADRVRHLRSQDLFLRPPAPGFEREIYVPARPRGDRLDVPRRVRVVAVRPPVQPPVQPVKMEVWRVLALVAAAMGIMIGLVVLINGAIDRWGVVVDLAKEIRR